MALWRYNRDHDKATGQHLYFSKDTPFPTGLYTATSPDGIHWPEREQLVHTHADGFGDTYTWMLDTLRKGYRLFGKRLYWDERFDSGKRHEVIVPRLNLRGQPGTWVRLRHTCWSPDFASWSPHVPILPIDENDRPHDQIYMNNGFVYDDMYVGFAQILHALDSWALDIDLTFSRNGEDWQRPVAARRILPRGEGTSWDSGRMAMFPSPPVREGDSLHFYYTTGAQYHRPAPPRDLPEENHRPAGLCLATLRVDGFASMRAPTIGQMRTRPMFVQHPHLTVNLNSAGGGFKVGLLDEGGVTLPGFGIEEMESISVDAIEHRLQWHDRDSISELQGRWISLEIQLQNSELFAVNNTAL